MILVTKPFLPPVEEYNLYIKDIWDRNWLTNMGPLSLELEYKLQNHLNLSNVLFVNNGTIALQMAIKALGLKGEIITTPFSFVATTSSIVWEGCIPVFVDIDQNTYNIDSSKIEMAITEETTAILATHVYGNPCDVLKIEEIAKRYNLKVIYDGAHAFDVKIKGKSIFEYGDISTCSFHATKLYHTIEGGMVVTNDLELQKKLKYIRNFGFDGPENFAELGINGKNSEFHAAMGLINLKYIKEIHKKRAELTNRYDLNLKLFNGSKPQWHEDSNPNNAYYPLLFESEELLLFCMERLKQKEIYSRRYFYPSLTVSLPYVNSIKLPVAEDISKRVVCLPLYFDLSHEEVDYICETLILAQNEFKSKK